MSLDISVKGVGFAQAERMLQGVKNGFPKVAAEAINYGLRAGRTRAAREIRARYNIQSSALKEKGLKVNKANKSTLEGSVEARGPMLPISLFVKSKVAKFKKFGKRKYQVVTAEVIRGSKKLIKGAFWGKGRIWKRKGPQRDAELGVVSTIGVPYMIRQTGILTDVEKVMTDKTRERLQHLVKRALAARKGAK